MTSGLTCATAPIGITKILQANLDVIAKIELMFGGVRVTYVRSGGQGPTLYRKSFFDEIKLSMDGPSTLSQTEIGQLILLISTSLHVTAASGSAAFCEFTEGLPIRVRFHPGEQRA
jgi:hypothetical protein